MISVIVPVYNIEQYLIRCVDSILNQSYTNLELILVNDGSTDNSPSICNSYSEKDDRVKTFHQKNKGVSAARNKGIREAKGKWVVFIDGDDWIEKNTFNKILDSKLNSDLEIIIARSFINDGLNLGKEEQAFDNAYTNKVNSGIEIAVNKSYKRGSVCGVVYNRNFLLANNLTFPPNIRNGEDTIFSTLATIYANKVQFVDIHFYNIYEREGSASRSWDFERIKLMLNNIRYINQYTDEHSSLTKEARNILDYDKYRIVSGIFNAFAECFKMKEFIILVKKINLLIDSKLDIGDIKTNKSKVAFFNISTMAFAASVVMNRKTINMIKS